MRISTVQIRLVAETQAKAQAAIEALRSPSARPVSP